MTNDPGLSRRVARLENDTESIYELITEVRSTQDEHTRRFDRIESTLDEHTRGFDRIESTLDEHTRGFERIERTLGEVVRRLPESS
jgi:hypothetical protein